MRFEAVIFDYEGVLVEMDRERAFSFFRDRSPLPVKAITRRWEAWCADQLGEHLPATEMWHAFWDALREEVTVPEAVLEEIRAFDYIGLLEVCPQAVDALREARRLGLRIGVLSNSVLPRLESPSAPIVLAELVDAIHVPGRGAPVKPDRAAYLEMARLLGTSPDRCLFFDNDPAFVQAARDVGMTAYLVKRGVEASAGGNAPTTDLSDLRSLAGAEGPLDAEKA